MVIEVAEIAMRGGTWLLSKFTHTYFIFDNLGGSNYKVQKLFYYLLCTFTEPTPAPSYWVLGEGFKNCQKSMSLKESK